MNWIVRVEVDVEFQGKILKGMFLVYVKT